ncbi:50S ribosomal protein L18 [Anaerosporomusa subterranea]|uniref:Large ribosomal subunit protein uL18 n=1 Tax=Anaerosporomusa subterranea TaxID=1794912 RepID=A0A154BUY5_ANASB|nr:50S ribosomal protein L18 [Anaerosporomusa subterranea]KYZ77717.1 50S ribosomal protein L18 [Anaerosporomusa subterranea]
MIRKANKNELRKQRHLRVRKTLHGTTERPRLNVFRSLHHIYAQIINDETGVTLVSASTVEKEVSASLVNGGNTEAAKAVGTAIAKRAAEKGIEKVVFDRGGYIYHGRVAALAAAAREAGLDF